MPFVRPIIVVVLLLLLALPSQAVTAPLGVYVLAPWGNRLDLLGTLLERDDIVGISLGFDWNKLEAVEGRYDWQELEETLKRLHEKGKVAILGVYPGITTPEWVFEKGAERFTFRDENPNHSRDFYPEGHRFSTYGQVLSLPVPWSEPFLAAWERFVSALGKHFSGSDSLAMVIVTGPNRHSAEMHLPQTAADKKQWQRLGYTPEHLITAWSRSIDAFAKAFPTLPLILHLSPTINPADGVTETVAAYGIKRYGSRFYLQNDILRADNGTMKRIDWAILKRYANETVIGFQRGLLRPAGWTELPRSERLKRLKSNLQGMFARGIDFNARYFEIGPHEARQFPEIVKNAAQRLGNTKK
ncbi:MAG: hypothetical protein C0621_02305 [Desulfuromonas sp.]|mgnify:CR=1 FL=1|nr:MAG: hypothetical protein C0621_02305 [Desulfuromonas sp.]